MSRPSHGLTGSSTLLLVGSLLCCSAALPAHPAAGPCAPAARPMLRSPVLPGERARADAGSPAASPAAVTRSSGEESYGGRTAGEGGEATGTLAEPPHLEAEKVDRAADTPFLHEGILRNPAHGFQVSVPAGWSLLPSATAELMEFSIGGCGECAFRILVSPGNDLPVEDTVRGIKQEILRDANAVIIDEEVVRIARQKGYTLIREDLVRDAPPKGIADQPAAPGTASADQTLGRRVRTRYVTLNHSSDKLYMMLKAPRERFAAEDGLFETLLESLRFKP